MILMRCYGVWFLKEDGWRKEGIKESAFREELPLYIRYSKYLLLYSSTPRLDLGREMVRGCDVVMSHRPLNGWRGWPDALSSSSYLSIALAVRIYMNLICTYYDREYNIYVIYLLYISVYCRYSVCICKHG